MLVPLTLFTQLAASCAPAVHVDTLAAVARAESGFNTLAIHLNGGGAAEPAATREDAIGRATELIVVQRRSVDLGLMQVNSANLTALGLSIADAFDPCRSLAAGAHLLAAGYAAARASGAADPQHALRAALSRYNTGDPARGFANGYIAKVQAAAEQVVPALRLGDGAAGPPAGAGQGGAPAEPAPAAGPASWDVYGQARAARERGTSVAVPSPGPAPSAPAASPLDTTVPLTPATPVRLRATHAAAGTAR